MRLDEAKKILNENGFLLEYFTEEGTLEDIEEKYLVDLWYKIKKLKLDDGKQAFVLSPYGEVFQKNRHGYMVRIRIPNTEDDSGSFIGVNAGRERPSAYHKSDIEEGFSADSFGYFWDIVEALEKLGIMEKWTKLFRSKKTYPLDQLIPFLKDLLEVWNEDFYKIVYKISKRKEAEEIAADIANYKGQNWSGD